MSRCAPVSAAPVEDRMMPKTSRETGRLKGVDMPAVARPTPHELAEFERLDATAPLDEKGRPSWSFEGEPLTARERRWLELYRRLRTASSLSKTKGRRR
jgi:hypothetical protein